MRRCEDVWDAANNEETANLNKKLEIEVWYDFTVMMERI